MNSVTLPFSIVSLILAGMQDVTQSDILKKLDELPLQSNAKSVHGGVLVNTEEIDDYGMTFLSVLFVLVLLVDQA